MRIQLAHFPFQKTLEQFDFGFQPAIDQRQVEELATLSFMAQGGNVVLLGPPGVGKTHLAVGLGLKACLAGYSVYFLSAHELARRLLASLADDSIDAKLFEFAKYKLLIIDELGYLPYERQQATLLFQLIARRYEHVPTIITTNKSFGQWAEIFGGDAAVASAILDRLLHHATVINIRALPTGSKTDNQPSDSPAKKPPAESHPRKEVNPPVKTLAQGVGISQDRTPGEFSRAIFEEFFKTIDKQAHDLALKGIEHAGAFDALARSGLLQPLAHRSRRQPQGAGDLRGTQVVAFRQLLQLAPLLVVDHRTPPSRYCRTAPIDTGSTSWRARVRGAPVGGCIETCARSRT